MEKLPENVFSIVDNPPSQKDADKNGRILYFSPCHGWSSGHYMGTWMRDATHWTYCPEAPDVEVDPAQRVEQKFDRWMRDAYPNADEIMRSVLRIGFFAAFKSLGVRV